MSRNSSFIYLSLFMFLFACRQGEGNTEPGPGMDSLREQIATLEKKLKAGDSTRQLLLTLSDLQLKNSDTLAATQSLALWLRNDSLDTEVLLNLASLSQKRGDVPTAIRCYQQLIPLLSEPGFAWIELGFLYADIPDPRALRVADQLLKTSVQPNEVANAHLIRGIYFTNSDQSGPALQAFDDCILHDYTFIDAYIEKGILQYRLKDFKSALQTFERARAVQNTHAEAYLWTAKCLEALGRTDEALDFYRKTLGLDESLREAAERARTLETR